MMLTYIAKRQRRDIKLRAQLAGRQLKFPGSDDYPKTDELDPEQEEKLNAYITKRRKEMEARAKAKKG